MSNKDKYVHESIWNRKMERLLLRFWRMYMGEKATFIWLITVRINIYLPFLIKIIMWIFPECFSFDSSLSFLLRGLIVRVWAFSSGWCLYRWMPYVQTICVVWLEVSEEGLRMLLSSPPNTYIVLNFQVAMLFKKEQNEILEIYCLYFIKILFNLFQVLSFNM